MKTMIIKPLVVACLAALLHVNFAAVPAAKTETEEVETDTSFAETEEDAAGYEVTCETDETGACTVTVITSDGEEQTFEVPGGENFNKLVSTVDGDITIYSEPDENGNDCVYVSSECVIDDGEDDGVEKTGTCTINLSDADAPPIIAE